VNEMPRLLPSWVGRLFCSLPKSEPGFVPDDVEPPTSRPEALVKMGVGRTGNVRVDAVSTGVDREED
jgi:hypothetical protein